MTAKLTVVLELWPAADSTDLNSWIPNISLVLLMFLTCSLFMHHTYQMNGFLVTIAKKTCHILPEHFKVLQIDSCIIRRAHSYACQSDKGVSIVYEFGKRIQDAVTLTTLENGIYEHKISNSLASLEDIPDNLITGKDVCTANISGETEKETEKRENMDEADFVCVTANVKATRGVQYKRRFYKRNSVKEKQNSPRSKIGIFESFECVAQAVIQLRHGKCLSMTPSKKKPERCPLPLSKETEFVCMTHLLLVLYIYTKCYRIPYKALLYIALIMARLPPADASQDKFNESTGRKGLYEYKLLLTLSCQFRDVIRKSTCHLNQESKTIYINYCGFAELCDPGFKPVCIDSVDGMLHICSKENLTCPRGYRRRAWLNRINFNIVMVEEEKCPAGTYQLKESSCYEACINEHGNIEQLPEQYAIFSGGDNISPPLIYCDFKKGFYNRDGETFIMYDSDTKFNYDFCINISEEDPCTDRQYPLPNGTCVSRCTDGTKRDVHDDFRCRAHSRDFNGSRVKEKMTTDNESNGSGTTREGIGITSTPNVTGRTTKKDEQVNYLSVILITVAATVVFTTFIVCIVCIVCLYWKRTREERRNVKISTTNRTANKTSIENVQTVNIYSNGCATEPMLTVDGED